MTTQNDTTPAIERARGILRVAMLGTTDGDFIDPDSDIPAGEMYRLAAESLTAALSAVLDVEEMARVLSDHSGFYFREDYPSDDWYVCDSCGVELETDASAVVSAFHDHQAEVLRRVILREA